MPLKSKSVFPPGGIQFLQPQTGFQAPYPLAEHVEALADRLISHRIQNPRFNLNTSRQAVVDEIENYNCYRLGYDPNWCEGKPAPQTKSNGSVRNVRVVKKGCSTCGRK